TEPAGPPQSRAGCPARQNAGARPSYGRAPRVDSAAAAAAVLVLLLRRRLADQLEAERLALQDRGHALDHPDGRRLALQVVVEELLHADRPVLAVRLAPQPVVLAVVVEQPHGLAQ